MTTSMHGSIHSRQCNPILQGNGATEAAKPDEASSPEKAVSPNLVQQQTAYGLHLPAPVA